jgi:hypothetical protein
VKQVVKCLAVISIILALRDPTAIAQIDPPANGFVPDADTAIKIAKAILLPIYGQERLQKWDHVAAIQSSETWEITLAQDYPRMAGGAVIVILSRGDGRVLRVMPQR